MAKVHSIFVVYTQKIIFDKKMHICMSIQIKATARAEISCEMLYIFIAQNLSFRLPNV